MSKSGGNEEMKLWLRKLVVCLLLTALCCVAVSAAQESKNMTFKTAVTLNTGYANLGLGGGGDGFLYALAINGDFTTTFSNNFGPYIRVGMNIPDTMFELYPAAAYTLPLNETMDLMFTAGPTFLFQERLFSMGMDILVHYEFYPFPDFFLRLSSGLEMSFFTSAPNAGIIGGFWLFIPIPRIALGYRF